MLGLFWLVLLICFLFNFGGKSRGFVTNIVATSFKLGFLIMSVLLIVGLLLKAGVIH